MTRVSVYAGLLVFSIAATILTIVSISLPRWVNYSVTTAKGDHILQTIGLHQSCSNLRDPPCQTFPTEEQCDASSDDKAHFCHLWRSAGFLANLAVALHLVMVVVYLFLVSGGKQRREQGWKVLAGLLGFVAVVEYVIIGIVSYAYDNDEQFLIPGWSLDTSWLLCIISASVSIASAIALTASHYLLPPEGGYDFLEDPVTTD